MSAHDIHDFRELVKKRREEKREAQAPALHMLERAAVDATYLTASPYWDKYLSMIQACIDTSEKHRQGIEAKLSDPTMVNHDEIMRLKIALAEVTGRIEAWRSAVELPSQLMDADAKAKA